jgi:hypothetical protein
MGTTKMPEVHVNVTSDASGNQIVFHNGGRTPLPPSAGQPMVATVKTPGNPNATVHGQINSGSAAPGPVFDNPA